MGSGRNKRLQTASRRSRKRRFCGNQFTAASPSSSDSSSEEDGDTAPRSSVTHRSSSSRKLSGIPTWFDDFSDEEKGEDRLYSNPDSSSSDEGEDEDEVFELSSDVQIQGNRLVDMPILQTIFREVTVCSSCKEGQLILSESTRAGLTSSIKLACSNRACAFQRVYALGEMNGRFFDANRRSVLAMRRIGRGHATLKKFCGVMNMPGPVTECNFRRHQKALLQASSPVAERSMNAAAAEVRQFQTNETGVEHQTGCAVTFDGTWMRRGFSSLFGEISCISWDTGRVVDADVLSKFCQGCSLAKSRFEQGKMTHGQYVEWQEAHRQECSSTVHCSSPAMESKAAVMLWKQSEKVRGLKYSTFIGDGDSKSYTAVREAKPYGGDESGQVVKEECVGHVQKRLGTALRKLKKDLKGTKLDDGKPIGGKGRLTDPVIDTLMNYYGMAIKKNKGDLQGMAKEVWAGLLHRSSTDDKPQHQYCPEGAESWCGWQRVKAGVDETYEHHDPLPQAIFEKLKPIYVRLASKDLLQRCLRGATQNANESFNGLVWSYCTKESFCGADTVEIACNLAVLQFNDGAKAIQKVLEEMGCPVGVYTINALELEDKMRVHKCQKKEAEEEKKQRKVRKRRRKGREEQTVDEEGTTYEAGAF